MRKLLSPPNSSKQAEDFAARLARMQTELAGTDAFGAYLLGMAAMHYREQAQKRAEAEASRLLAS